MVERKKPSYATTILGCVKRICNHPDHDLSSETADLLWKLEEIGRMGKEREKLPEQAAKLRAKAEKALAEAARLEENA